MNFNTRKIVRILAGFAMGLTVESSVAFAQTEGAAQSANPIAEDLYQFPPQSLSELVKAARTTQQLDRIGDARAFLRKVMDQQPSDTELRGLRRELGPGIFFDLRLDSRLSPESEELLAAINRASLAGTQQTADLQALVSQLPSNNFRSAEAAAELIEAGDNAVPLLLSADPATPEGKIAGQILHRHAHQFRYGLLNQLDGADEEKRSRILQLLTHAADRQIAIRLLRWQFDPAVSQTSHAARNAVLKASGNTLSIDQLDAAVNLLLAEARHLIRQSGERFSAGNVTLDSAAIEQALPADKSIVSAQRLVEQAQFDLAANLISRQDFEAAKASLLTATQGRTQVTEQFQFRQSQELIAQARQLVADALVLSPTEEAAQSLTLVTECAAVAARISAETGPTAAAGKSEVLLRNALSESLELHQGEAAVELLRAILALPAEKLDADAISPVLRKAIVSPDVRVRQLTAHLCQNRPQIEVRKKLIEDALRAAKNGQTASEAVVVTPDDGLLTDLQLALQESGYRTEIAQTGPQGFELAVSQLNCDLFLLSAEAPVWTLPVTIANLRADARTRYTPIVIFGSDRFEARIMELARLYPGIWFTSEPVGLESLAVKLHQLPLPTPLLTSDDRAALTSMAEQN